MKYCNHCGVEIDDDTTKCPNCGAKNKNTTYDDDMDGSGLIACLFPLIGLILYLVWRENRPKRARRVAIGAIIGTVISIVLSIYSFIAPFALISKLLQF